MALADLYRAVFVRVRGRGLGLGVFNWLHRNVWEKGLQPEWVTAEGSRLKLPPHDEGVADSLRLDGVYEPELTAAFKDVLRPGMTVVDIGANVGYYTLLCARLVGPEGRVHAFEPAPDTYALLEENVRANKRDNVVLHKVGASDRAGEGKLNVCADAPGCNSMAVDFGGTPVTIQTARVDDVVAGDADVIKIDVEGHEPTALRGMERLLASPRLEVLFLEVNESALSAAGSTAQTLFAQVNALGLSCERIDRFNWRCTRRPT